MEKVLLWFSGKKGVSATILMAFVAYAAAKGLISEPEVTLFTVIIGALFGSASYATKKLVYKK